MTGPADFARLARNWDHWCHLARLVDPSVSTQCQDCAVLFSSADYSVHLRRDSAWWSVDTVNDRRQRVNDTARFSSYALAEKYLVWVWASAARSALQATVLGKALYALGFDAGVEAVPLSEGVFELRSPTGRAVLTEPYATIFSHLMDQPEEQIEKMVGAGL